MTSRVFQEEIAASEAKKSFSSVRSAYIATFGGTAKDMLSAVYLGNGLYKVTYRTTSVGSMDFGRFGTPSVSFVPVTRTKTFQIHQGKLVIPSVAKQAVVDDSGQLQRLKQRWSNWIIEHKTQISPNQQAAFTRLVQTWTGSAADLQSSMSIASRNLDFGLTATREGGEDLLTADLFGGGGGGGGGFLGPEYVKPDRRVIEDGVMGSMVALVGTVLDDELDRIVDIFMSEDRRNFDTPNEQISPNQSVLEAIEATKEYKTIHELRPDSQDARTWISDRRKAAEAGGLSVEQQEAFAITQATVGGDIEDVEEAAGFAQFQSSGRAPDPIQARIRIAARGVFQGIRK